MEANKILSADWLDLLFDGRNKTYGAYELRKTYARRVIKAILLTGIIVALVVTSTVLANTLKPAVTAEAKKESVVIREIMEEVKKPEPEPELPKAKPAAPAAAPPTAQLSSLVITDDPVESMTPQEDFANAAIDVRSGEGTGDPHIQVPDPGTGDDRGLAEPPKKQDGGGFVRIEMDAKFDGNWEKFLHRYLDAEVAVNNGAPEGRHTVIIQFTVDIDGSVSDIRPLTSIGYGMEQEAIRVLKKAAKWKPAVQNGYPVKTYRKQPITFEVTNNTF